MMVITWLCVCVEMKSLLFGEMLESFVCFHYFTKYGAIVIECYEYNLLDNKFIL